MAGDQIKLSVEVTDFKAAGGSVEISGQATQVGGGFADIYKIVDMTEATEDDPGEWFVTVTADTAPPYRFRKDQDVTVYVRTAKVWVSVLGEQTGWSTSSGEDPTADDDTKWDKRGAVIQVNGKKWPKKGPPTTY
jgi:hypothetical protein